MILLRNQSHSVLRDYGVFAFFRESGAVRKPHLPGDESVALFSRFTTIPTDKYESSCLLHVSRLGTFLQDVRVGESNCGHFHWHRKR